MPAPWKKSYDQTWQQIKNKRHYITDNCPSNQIYSFSSGHVGMWELDYKENWAPKNWCFYTVVLEKTLESPLNCKEIQPVNPKGNQSCIFIGKADAEIETETAILLSPDMKNWLIECTLMLGKIEGRRRRGRHHQLKGHEFEQGPGVDGPWCAAVHEIAKSLALLSAWTELNSRLNY